jgi:nucleoside-diphosphate-sugar epimerase
MVEFNNTEGVNNNVLGTLKCAQAAIDAKVKTFVLISTDKAVVIVIRPFSLICLVNSGITEPLEPNTLPKRTIVN